MGVLRFFRHLLNTYKQFYTSVHANSSHSFDVVLLDLNAIFHPACRDVYAVSEFKDLLHRSRPTATQLSPEQKEQKAFKRVTEIVEAILVMAKPRREVYFAIDGVAGMAKQSQQRKRRYVAAKNRIKDGWNFANITAGTEWMERLQQYFEAWIVEKKKPGGLLHGIRVLYSNMFVPGEGEQKAIRYLAATSTDRTSYCVYSPDADLIFLCLLLPRGQGYILRDNIYDDIEGKYILVNCNELKRQIVQGFRWIATVEESEVLSQASMNTAARNQREDRMNSLFGSTELSRVCKDYSCFIFTVGNDFLPSLYALGIDNKGIPALEKAYVKVVMRHSYLVNEVNGIQQLTFASLMTELAASEPALVLYKYLRGSKYADNLLASCIVHKPVVTKKELDDEVVGTEGQTYQTVDWSLFVMKYYTSKFPECAWVSCEDAVQWYHQPDNQRFIHEICAAYIHGLNFVLTYYVVSIPTFAWYYPYHYAPLLCDLATYATHATKREWNKLQEWTYKPALTLNQALLGIIPPSSRDVVPAPVQTVLAKNEQHPLFVEEFVMDLEGKQQDYEASVLLPNVDYNTLKRMCKDPTKPQELKVYS
jgi:5'-3' exonuclease